VRIKMAKKLTNTDLKIEMLKSGVKQYQVANKIGITETHLSRLFHRELTDEYKEKVMAAIKELKGE
jgi:predicted XRE-type DNA-binding protein